MRVIEYPNFEAAFAAMMDFASRGIRCKGIGKTKLLVWDDTEK